MVVTADRRFDARAVGTEIDPLRYLWHQVLISDMVREDGNARFYLFHPAQNSEED